MTRIGILSTLGAMLIVALPVAAADSYPTGRNRRAPLPVPLKLPPGLVQVLPIDKAESYMGDAVRIPDCPKNEDNPFGVCGNTLFGGLGLWNSHLSGVVQIKFYPPINEISHFELSQPYNLKGDDAVMRTPQLYAFGAASNLVLDTFNEYSSGDLNLRTGEVTNLKFNVIFFNIWYYALGLVNPKLKPPSFTFPGIYGMADMTFEQRPDGLLDFTFYGSTFLPLGNNIDGDPVRLPMPFCGPLLQCGSIQVPGMSLHPHLRLSSKAGPKDPPCGATCYEVPYNSVIELTINSRFSSIGDDFFLNIPQLGEAIGRSQMQGRVQLQFGEQNGDYVPVAINALPPGGLLAPPPAFPIRGISLGWVGHDERLQFPRFLYEVKEVAITDDPFDVPLGELNVKTGKFVGGVIWRTFWAQDLLTAILDQNLGRILPQSFLLSGPAVIQKGVNNQIAFRFDGAEYRPFDTFNFPLPDYKNTGGAFRAGPGSYLTPFFKAQAVMPTDTPTALMTGSASNVRSSFGETFSYSYSIPCDPAGKSFAFEYTNSASGKTGGTFKMDGLASVQCFNSLTSTLRPGNYDTVAFSGFGSWSKDKDPHIATVQISTAPNAPYVSIQIDATLSNVNLKPAEIPVP
jgi:hypothetical protein